MSGASANDDDALDALKLLCSRGCPSLPFATRLAPYSLDIHQGKDRFIQLNAALDSAGQRTDILSSAVNVRATTDLYGAVFFSVECLDSDVNRMLPVYRPRDIIEAKSAPRSIERPPILQETHDNNFGSLLDMALMTNILSTAVDVRASTGETGVLLCAVERLYDSERHHPR
ncbi:hypothetical protein FB451DRAFT_1168625 [Mycena latifolia]|nr:hypothetical protein FB451DRAFT_1168625 [Mycena latifolia]